MLTVLLLTQKTIWEIPVTTVYTQIEPAIADICIYIKKKNCIPLTLNNAGLNCLDPLRCGYFQGETLPRVLHNPRLVESAEARGPTIN